MKTTILRTFVVMSSLLAILSLSVTAPRGSSASGTSGDVSNAANTTNANNNTNTNSNVPASDPNSESNRILQRDKFGCCSSTKYAEPTSSNANKSK